MTLQDKILYFGCRSKREMGHYSYHRRTSSMIPRDLYCLDGRLLKDAGVPDRAGRAAYVKYNGFSILTWWDNGGDSRGASNSAFYAEGDYTAEELLEAGRAVYPDVMARQLAEIVLYRRDGQK